MDQIAKKRRRTTYAGLLVAGVIIRARCGIGWADAPHRDPRRAMTGSHRLCPTNDDAKDVDR
jgi:hypothetical protein